MYILHVLLWILFLGYKCQEPEERDESSSQIYKIGYKLSFVKFDKTLTRTSKFLDHENI